MKISDNDLRRFIDIYAEKTGVMITKTEAVERASALLMLIKSMVDSEREDL